MLSILEHHHLDMQMMKAEPNPSVVLRSDPLHLPHRVRSLPVISGCAALRLDNKTNGAAPGVDESHTAKLCSAI